ncbi:MAG: rod shape-determining protein RodA [Bacteroidales bacterium]|nr:rod shape-determining protein RodA [Bacteroidales bacterium]MBP7036078.1 rod shape-determining protein RodA [Bacteroidales bacterium]HPH73671.1 rod shape-determining protein RodA [Bacteroidales bacterium]HPX53410.1 rod shape-determining protein RodA [Bacteroidales bacterium]HQL46010.1 rod shape-determining protein RodA [Bacteroidales bacterium]
MERSNNILARLDWVTVMLWLVMMIMGWLNIYAAVYNEQHTSIFDMSQRYGKQLIFIIAAIVLAVMVMVTDNKFWFFFAWFIYGFFILMLILVLIIGKEINGAKAWFGVGAFSIQPSEFAKFATGLALASYLNSKRQMLGAREVLAATAIIIVPVLLIALQPDMGSVVTYFAFFIVLYREGVSIWVFITAILAVALFFLTLILGNLPVAIGLLVAAAIVLLITSGYMLTLKAAAVMAVTGGVAFLIGHYILDLDTVLIIVLAVILAGMVYAWFIYRLKLVNQAIIYAFLLGGLLYLFTVDYAFHTALKPHQQTRINIMLGMEDDPFGEGYNLNQSLISIGSGGFTGKGYLNGTQTKFKFVPEQSTDFIFCTVGEEWGFIGSMVVIGLFVWLLLRLMMMAERQRTTFVRAYGYGVFALFLVHFFVNIGMTIGVMPVIGIPLPFFSYGGSSLWGFTMLLFIFLRLDAGRTEYLG